MPIDEKNVHVSPMRQKLLLSLCQSTHTIPVHACLPNSCFLLENHSHGCTCHWLQKKWKGFRGSHRYLDIKTKNLHAYQQHARKSLSIHQTFRGGQKLIRRYTGPFKVIQHISSVTPSLLHVNQFSYLIPQALRMMHNSITLPHHENGCFMILSFGCGYKIENKTKL